jgi:transposase
MKHDSALLVNGIRSSAIGKPDGRELMSMADLLESVLERQEHELSMLHGTLAHMSTELAAVKGELATTKTELAEKTEKLANAEERLRINAAQRFGRSSERWTPYARGQADLFNEPEVILAAAPADEAVAAPEIHTESVTKVPAPAKARGKRKPLPEDLPRVDTVIDLPDSEKVCTSCGKPLARIGEDVSERLQMKPAEWSVQRTIRPTYACSCGCGGIHEAPVPVQLLPRSIVGETVAAQMIASKYCDALPFYRQEVVLATRWGIDISRQTMARVAQSVASILSPLETLITKRLAGCAVLCGDETRVRVLFEEGKAKAGQSWMWVAAGEDEGIRYVRFRYDPGRDADAAKALLAGFSGILMTDGYGAYNAIAQELGITQAACMAHSRRRFAEILKADPKNRLAREAVDLFGELYSVERLFRDKPPDELHAARQEQSRPIFERLRAWLHATAPEVRPKSPLSEAITYTVKLLPRLEIYLSDARVPIDNNRAENAIRPFVVGRKSWMFNDQAQGAKTSATLYSVIETARANTMEPMHYLLFLFRCYERFGPAGMEWEKLLPIPSLREYADRIGIPWGL